jgi:hypothetical protein
MIDDLVKLLREAAMSWRTPDRIVCDTAADRIEKLEAEEIEFDRVIGNYASENALFRDHIEKLEAALRPFARAEYISTGFDGNAIFARLQYAKDATETIPLAALDEARKALEGKDG